MSRLNLTLDDETASRLARLARKSRTPQAALARSLLKRALDAREAHERRQKIAADYAADRDDAADLLRDLEGGQWELLD